MVTSFSISQRQNLETFTLVWLDSLVNVSPENIDTKLLFRKAINPLKAFEDSDKCVEYIQSVSGKRIVLIVSGRLGREVVPRIHELPQLIAIYVYCSDKKRNEAWVKDFIKIKNVIVDLNELIAQIQTDQAKRNEYQIDQPLPICFFHTKSPEKQKSSIDNNNFIYAQLLIDCLSRMKSNSNTKEELIALCKDETESYIVRAFEEKYSPDRAIWWFSRESFISRMLNKAFQIINIDLLYSFHFFIHDIQRQLKKNKCSSPIRTYRAQLMSNEEIQLLKYSIGELISINTFLPTIPNRERALALLESSHVSNELKRVLFEINADPQLNDIQPFSNISSLSYFTGIEVILFMAGTIFQPVNIQEEDGITVIQMEACGDSDERIKTILESMKAECYNGGTNLLSLSHILLKTKQFDDAERYYNRVLRDMPNDHYSVARCYQGLGSIAMEKHDYDSCLQWYQKALDTNRLVLRSEDPEIASGYNDIAYIYVKKGEFNQAFESYMQALQIWIRALGKDHPKVATCYINIACAFEMNERYFEALEYFEKAVTLRERNLSTDRHDVAKLHKHIADMYASVDEMNQALKHYKFAIKIFTKAHSNKHPEVLSTMRNLGLVHETLGNLDQALANFEKIASKRRQILPRNHPDVIQIVQDIQRVSSQMHKNISFSVDL